MKFAGSNTPNFSENFEAAGIVFAVDTLFVLVAEGNAGPFGYARHFVKAVEHLGAVFLGLLAPRNVEREHSYVLRAEDMRGLNSPFEPFELGLKGGGYAYLPERRAQRPYLKPLVRELF